MSFHSATPPTSPDETTHTSNNPFYHSASRNSCQIGRSKLETSRKRSSHLPTPPRTKNASKLFIYSSPSESSSSRLSFSPPTTSDSELSSSSSIKATRVSRPVSRPVLSFELAPALDNGLCPPPEIVEFSWSARSKRDTSSCTTRVPKDNQFLFSSSLTPPFCSPADSTASADSLPIASSSLDVPDYFTFSPSSSSRTLQDPTRQHASSPPLTPLETPPAESSRRSKRSRSTRQEKSFVRNTDPKKGPVWDEKNPFLEGIGSAWIGGDESESDSETESSWNAGARSGWLKRQRIGELHEKQTIGYVFRGAKTMFANPHFGPSQSSPPSERSLSHPDFSPPSNPRPRLLFPPQTTPRRPTALLPGQLQSITRTTARPVFTSDSDNDDDDDEGMLMATPRKLFTSTVQTDEQSKLARCPRKEEAQKWSLSESTPRSNRSSNTLPMSSTEGDFGVCLKRDDTLQRELGSGCSNKRSSGSTGIDSLGRKDAKRLRY